MPPSIHLDKKAQRLLDHTSSDIIDRYKDWLLEDESRYLWLGDKLLLDVEQVIRRRFTCNTELCVKHKRDGDKAKIKSRHSCCWDLEVQLLPTEVPMIEGHLETVFKHYPGVKKHVERDGFYNLDEEWWKVLQKRRNDGPCVFFEYDPDMKMNVCALHGAALKEGIPLKEIKPLICRMFPLFLLETDELNIITFYSKDTHRILFDEEYEKMNCLHPNDLATDHVYRFMGGILTDLVGEKGYEKICEHAERILAEDAAKAEGNGH